MKTSTTNIYDLVVNQIIEKLEEGVIPWKKSWKGGVPTNYSNNTEYKGINRLLLSMNDFESNYYLTYKQIKNLGGSLQKGSKAIKIIYWNILKSDSDKDGDTKENIQSNQEESGNKKIIARYYNVFNIEQTDLVPGEMMKEEKEIDSDYEKCNMVLEIYKNKPHIRTGSHPCYSVLTDTILVPEKEKFESIDSYYGTLFHELVHSTGNKDRLARDGVVTTNYFGSETYSKEELIAEIGAMFLCNYCNIANSTVENSVSYIGNWLKFLKENKREIVSAASKAEKAVEYIVKKGLCY